jgi:nucleoside-diphosphate-sugar epimerase
VPRILARSGRLRRIGTANKLIDSIYIDNAADAHLLAADRLQPGSPVAGRAYFLSNGEPMPLWDLVNRILAAADLPPVTRTMPASVAYALGWLLEVVYGLWRIQREPPLTRFVARELATAHWFDLTAARRDLDYRPLVSIEVGLRRLGEALRAAKAPFRPDSH